MHAVPTVLLLDDEPDIRLTAAGYLEGEIPGLKVEPFETGAAALARFQRGGVDLVISDYRMPGMNGIEFLAGCWRAAPSVPRILMTAYPDMDLAVTGVNEAHIDSFLVKPVDPPALLKPVTRLLGRKAS